jgi:hypothetical protein
MVHPQFDSSPVESLAEQQFSQVGDQLFNFLVIHPYSIVDPANCGQGDLT